MAVDQPAHPTRGGAGEAILLAAFAGSAALIGGALTVSCCKRSNPVLLAGAMGLSAGVMTYISLVEILQTAATEFLRAGLRSDGPVQTAVGANFFGGWVIVYLLDVLVHAIDAGHAHGHGHGHAHSEGQAPGPHGGVSAGVPSAVPQTARAVLRSAVQARLAAVKGWASAIAAAGSSTVQLGSPHSAHPGMERRRNGAPLPLVDADSGAALPAAHPRRPSFAAEDLRLLGSVPASRQSSVDAPLPQATGPPAAGGSAASDGSLVDVSVGVRAAPTSRDEVGAVSAAPLLALPTAPGSAACTDSERSEGGLRGVGSGVADVTSPRSDASGSSGSPLPLEPASPPSRSKLSRQAVLVAVALILHSLPEGAAIAAGSSSSSQLGLLLAVALFVHKLPEGVAVAAPIYFATGSRLRALAYTAVAAAAGPIGAGLAIAMLSPGSDGPDPLVLGSITGAVAGIMTHIALFELLPSARALDPHNLLTGKSLAAGMFLMAVSLAALAAAGES